MTKDNIEIGSTTIEPKTRQIIELPIGKLPTLTPLSMRVEVVYGEPNGMIIFIGSTIHGDEINGIDVVQNVLDAISPETLQGCVIGIPVVNVYAFLDNSRYLPDRRDLNRSFPGNPKGSLAARTAHLFMNDIVKKCTHGIDLHTAPKGRYNHPQVRGDFSLKELRSMAEAFAAPVMIDGKGPQKSLRRTATDLGVPTLLFEGGEGSRFERSVIGMATRGCLRVMGALGMITHPPEERHETLNVESTYWLRASRSGLARLTVTPGQKVSKGDILGTIGDAFQEDVTPIRATSTGYIISMATYPIVIQGEALFHIAKSDE